MRAMACRPFPYARTGPSLVAPAGRHFQNISLSLKKNPIGDFPKTVDFGALIVSD
jgi:hypothetical protein